VLGGQACDEILHQTQFYKLFLKPSSSITPFQPSLANPTSTSSTSSSSPSLYHRRKGLWSTRLYALRRYLLRFRLDFLHIVRPWQLLSYWCGVCGWCSDDCCYCSNIAREDKEWRGCIWWEGEFLCWDDDYCGEYICLITGNFG
jgi:hypothetical protein